MAKKVTGKAALEAVRLSAIKELSLEKLQKVSPEDINAVLKRDKVKWRINVKKYDPKVFNEHPHMAALEDTTLTKKVLELFRRTTYNYYYIDNGRLAKKTSRIRPKRFDWRELGNVLTSVKDQGSCGSCVAFATAAAIEAQYRIQNYNTSQNTVDLSEASLFFTAQRQCNINDRRYGWDCSSAMEAAIKEGICLEYNYPYIPVNQEAHMSEGSNRILKIEEYKVTADVNQMKRWLIENGPLVSRYDFYNDFRSFWHYCQNETDVYTRSSLGSRDGGHVICIVGYDDDKKAWICKNSWGRSTAHPSGYFYMGYGECRIDAHMYLPVGVYDKITYDAISYNPANLRIVKETNDWLLTDGRSRMLIFDTEEDAKNGLKVAKRHTRQCFIGRSNRRSNRKDFILSYWEGNSGLPSEPLSKEDKISYNPRNVSVRYDAAAGFWRVVEKLSNNQEHYMFIADNMADALAMLSVTERYSKTCYIGRGNKRSNRKDFIMHYFE